jgi:hypothetical protein
VSCNFCETEFDILNQERKKYEPNHLVRLITTIMTSTELTEIYGRSIKPDELGKFLGIDRRTVVKYAQRWGGVEVSPGKWRFFENRIKEVLNAKFDKETWKEPLPSERDGQRCLQTEAVSRLHKKIISGSGNLGKRRKRKNGKATISDKFGLFNGN